MSEKDSKNATESPADSGNVIFSVVTDGVKNDQHSLQGENSTHFTIAKTANPAGTISCYICGRNDFKNKAAYSTHLSRSHYNKKRHVNYGRRYNTKNVCKNICEFCGKKYWSDMRLQCHILVDHFGVSSGGFEAIDWQHTPHSTGNITCPFCPRKGTLGKIVQHASRMHRGLDRPPQCMMCGKLFIDQASLTAHRETEKDCQQFLHFGHKVTSKYWDQEYTGEKRSDYAPKDGYLPPLVPATETQNPNQPIENWLEQSAVLSQNSPRCNSPEYNPEQKRQKTSHNSSDDDNIPVAPPAIFASLSSNILNDLADF